MLLILVAERELEVHAQGSGLVMVFNVTDTAAWVVHVVLRRSAF